MTDIEPRRKRAPELIGNRWFNGAPLSVSDLSTEVLLVVFWDHTCIHCRNLIPYVREWLRKYCDFGFAAVGVHTPKFPFGKDAAIVEDAIGRLGIDFPVVMDNDALLWAHYGIHVRPALVLVDRDGFIRYHGERESGCLEAEHMIQSLLHRSGMGGELPQLMEPLRDADRHGALLYRATPELLTGYLRGSIGNVEGYSPESIVEYDDPKIYLDGRFYAEGNWLNDRNYLRLMDDTGQLILNYEALEVHAVFRQEQGVPCEIALTQDDRNIGEAECGDDVQVTEDGRSVLVVREPRLYSLVRNPAFGQHVLKLASQGSGLELYSFAFVSDLMTVTRN